MGPAIQRFSVLVVACVFGVECCFLGRDIIRFCFSSAAEYTFSRFGVSLSEWRSRGPPIGCVGEMFKLGMTLGAAMVRALLLNFCL